PSFPSFPTRRSSDLLDTRQTSHFHRQSHLSTILILLYLFFRIWLNHHLSLYCQYLLLLLLLGIHLFFSSRLWRLILFSTFLLFLDRKSTRLNSSHVS